MITSNNEGRERERERERLVINIGDIIAGGMRCWRGVNSNSRSNMEIIDILDI